MFCNSLGAYPLAVSTSANGGGESSVARSSARRQSTSQLATNLPVLGTIPLFVICALRGTVGSNRYGAPAVSFGPRRTVERKGGESPNRQQHGVPDPLDFLERLHALRDKGVLTQAEFDEQKVRLLTQWSGTFKLLGLTAIHAVALCSGPPG